MEKQFALKKPCADCPFRKDKQAIDLAPGRKEEIIEALLSGDTSTFHCHKTVHRSDGRNYNEEGSYQPVDVSHCPGAAAVARKCGRDTVMVQVASRLGAIAEDHFDEALELTLDPDEMDIDRRKAHL